MKKLSFAVSAAMGALFSFAGASAQGVGVANPTSTIPNYDVESVGPILNEMGVKWQAQRTPAGETLVTASVADTVNFLLVPTACRDTATQSDCVGLNMVALFEGSANPQTVRAFNYRYAFASAGIDPDGDAYISRYEIADFGAQRGNLATSIQVFVNQAVMFGQELATARRTVSLEGYADDLSASMLNRAGVSSLTGVAAHAATAIDKHEQGFEKAATQIKQLIADKTTPRNKINNLNTK